MTAHQFLGRRVRCTRPLHPSRLSRAGSLALWLAVAYLTCRAFVPFGLALLGWR